MGLDMGALLKISFHLRSNEDRLARPPESPGVGDRLFEVWTRPAPVDGWTRLFDIVVPWTPEPVLGPLSVQNDGRIWPSPPRPGQKRAFALLLADVTHGRLEDPNADQVGDTIVSADGRMVVLVTALTLVEDDVAQEAVNLRALTVVHVSGAPDGVTLYGTAHMFHTDVATPWVNDVVLGGENFQFALP
jgi:hypothetical protein